MDPPDFSKSKTRRPVSPEEVAACTDEEVRSSIDDCCHRGLDDSRHVPRKHRIVGQNGHSYDAKNHHPLKEDCSPPSIIEIDTPAFVSGTVEHDDALPAANDSSSPEEKKDNNKEDDQLLLTISRIIRTDLWAASGEHSVEDAEQNLHIVKKALLELTDLCHGGGAGGGNDRDDSPKEKEAVRDCICQMGGPIAIVKIMERHVQRPDIQALACGALQNLSYNNDHGRQMIGLLGGVEAVVTALSSFPELVYVQLFACGALRSMAYQNLPNAKRIVTAGGIVAIVHAVKMHYNHARFFPVACSTLSVLAATGKDVACAIFRARGLAVLQAVVAAQRQQREDQQRDDDSSIHTVITPPVATQAATKAVKLVAEQVLLRTTS